MEKYQPLKHKKRMKKDEIDSSVKGLQKALDRGKGAKVTKGEENIRYLTYAIIDIENRIIGLLAQSHKISNDLEKISTPSFENGQDSKIGEEDQNKLEPSILTRLERIQGLLNTVYYQNAVNIAHLEELV